MFRSIRRQHLTASPARGDIFSPNRRANCKQR
jgi:hypothetical protein